MKNSDHDVPLILTTVFILLLLFKYSTTITNDDIDNIVDYMYVCMYVCMDGWMIHHHY